MITNFRWGEIIVAGDRRFRDARLFPGGADSWDWAKTDTHHDPGIQPEDFEDLVAHRADVIILSRGVDLVLQVPASTVDYAKQHAKTVLVLQSEEAVAEYNKRVAAERVIALIHSTC